MESDACFVEESREQQRRSLGELADDTDEGSVFVFETLVVSLQI